MRFLLIAGLTCSSVLLLPLIAQPLSLGLVIIIATLLICITAATLLSAWYGYILFLIYVGGLLVIFAYVAALSPNVLFRRLNALIFFFLAASLFSVSIYFYLFLDFSVLDYYYNSAEIKRLKRYGSALVSTHIASLLIGLGIILLVNLVVVVKICYYQRASLRPFLES